MKSEYSLHFDFYVSLMRLPLHGLCDAHSFLCTDEAHVDNRSGRMGSNRVLRTARVGSSKSSTKGAPDLFICNSMIVAVIRNFIDLFRKYVGCMLQPHVWSIVTCTTR